MDEPCGWIHVHMRQWLKKKKIAERLTPALNEKGSARHLAIITLQMCSEIDVNLRVALGTPN